MPYPMNIIVARRVLMQGIPAFGDSIGAMNIAGGIAAALFQRERTGKASELDVSLMSTGWWAAGSGIDMAMEVSTSASPLFPD
jgi:crotonobetainyl-CoA:carnitine CoA-transferase CaiB-like acyl-CoA transferase